MDEHAFFSGSRVSLTTQLPFASSRSSGKVRPICIIACTLLALVVGLVIGVIINKLGSDVTFVPNFDAAASLNAQHLVSAQRIRSYLKELTEKVHLAGTAENRHVQELLVRQMAASEFLVIEDSYDALLSFPSANRTNSVRLVASNGSIVHEATLHALAFNAFAPAASVVGEPLFVNYARQSDFTLLFDHNVSCAGKILFARYGKVFRGDKVKLAKNCGAQGIVLYLDPADYRMRNRSSVSVSPASQLQSDAIQLGTVMLDSANALLEKPVDNDIAALQLPLIPAQPISFKDADVFLSNLQPLFNYTAKKKLPRDWTSGLNSLLPGNVGPGYEGNWGGYQIQLETHNELRWVTITNVVARLEGAVEPDRYVIVGCHYDAWSYGATDPLSGTAIMLELATVLNERRKAHSWRPRRTIMLVHWDAEEPGLIGSTKFARRHRWELQQRTVAYFNLDAAVRGNWILTPGSTPELHEVIFNASRAVLAPGDDKVSLFDQWLARSQRNSSEPATFVLDSSSDHYSFAFQLGVASCAVASYFDSAVYAYSFYPSYHTLYENLSSIDDWLDPGFQYHAALAKLMVELVLRLADSQRLPLSAVRLASYVLEQSRRLQQLVTDDNVLNTGFLTYNLSVDLFVNSTQTLMDRAKLIQQHLSDTPLRDGLKIRRLNDVLVSFSRVFIQPRADGSLVSVLYSDGSSDAFPFLNAAISAVRANDALQQSDGVGYVHRWSTLRSEFNIVMQCVKNAIFILSH